MHTIFLLKQNIIEAGSSGFASPFPLPLSDRGSQATIPCQINCKYFWNAVGYQMTAFQTNSTHHKPRKEEAVNWANASEVKHLYLFWFCDCIKEYHRLTDILTSENIQTFFSFLDPKSKSNPRMHMSNRTEQLIESKLFQFTTLKNTYL